MLPATAEDIADSKVENQFGRCSRVNTAEDNRGRILSLLSRIGFANEIAVLRFARPEAFVASFHPLDDFVRRHLVTLLPGEVRAGQPGCQACLCYPDSVATPAALQNARRSNRFLPSFNFECCIAAPLRSTFIFYLTVCPNRHLVCSLVNSCHPQEPESAVHKPGAPRPSRGIRATIEIRCTLTVFPTFSLATLTK